MKAPSFGSIFLGAVTLLVGVGCSQVGTPGPTVAAGDAHALPQTPVDPKTAGAKRSPEDVAKHFKMLQDRNHALVRELAGHYYVYGLEGADLTKTRGPESWFSYTIETRERIEDIIKEIVQNSEWMTQDALELNHPELAAQAQEEELRANRLIASLESYKTHDHNRFHIHEAKHHH